MRTLCSASLVIVLGACGPSPAARSTRAHIERGDFGAAARAAGSDPDALGALARSTLGVALQADAAAVKIAAIEAVARLEIEELAIEVAMHVGSSDERVAAAA